MDEVLENFSRQLWTVDNGLFRFFWLQWKSSAGKTGSVSIVTTKVLGKPRKTLTPTGAAPILLRTMTHWKTARTSTAVFW